MTVTAELQFYVGQYVQGVHTGSGAHRASCSLGIGVKTAEHGVELHLYLSMCFPGVHRDNFTCTVCACNLTFFSKRRNRMHYKL
jgi:hypothetical protein